MPFVQAFIAVNDHIKYAASRCMCCAVSLRMLNVIYYSCAAEHIV